MKSDQPPLARRGYAQPPTQQRGTYIRIPARLLTEGLYSPQAVGVYALVARLWGIYKAAVPLSAADIARYDTTLSRGAALRALDWLTERGWLVQQIATGRKTHYTPTWGCVQGQTRLWQADISGFGRPAHIRTQIIDTRLLDVYIGRMTPYAGQQSACITRYLTAPALALADIGSYALLLIGSATETPALGAWGLARAGRALPMPDDATVLALASQRTLFHSDAPMLNYAGMERAGLPVELSDTAQPLFFVPNDVIGNLSTHLIGNVIAEQPVGNDVFDALLPHEAVPATAPARAPWKEHAKACKTSTHGSRGSKTEDILPLPETPATVILQNYQIAPENIRQLAQLSETVVQETIAVAEADPRIRHKRGWVVWALRAFRDHGFRAPMPEQGTTDWSAVAQSLGDGALLGSHDRVSETPLRGTPDMDVAGIASDFLHQQCEPIEVASGCAISLESLVRERWRFQFPTSKRAGMAGIPEDWQLEERPGLVRVLVAEAAHCSAAEQHLVPLISRCLRESGDTTRTVVVAVNAAHRRETPHHDASQPAWLPADVWRGLPAMLRAALQGATLIDGEIQAANPWRQSQLETRYHVEMARVRQACAASGTPTLAGI